MAKKIYTYGRTEGGSRLLLNGKPLLTPKATPIVMSNNTLAEKLMKELMCGQKHTDDTSIICYHYTYCDTKAQYTQRQVAEDLCASFAGCLDNDPYRTFSVNGKDAMPEASLQQSMKGMNYYQLIAMMVVLCSRETIMLPYAIMSWFVMQNADKPYKTLKSEFLAALEEYERTNFEIDDDDEPEFRKYLQKTARMIDSFVYYAKLT